MGLGSLKDDVLIHAPPPAKTPQSIRCPGTKPQKPFEAAREKVTKEKRRRFLSLRSERHFVNPARGNVLFPRAPIPHSLHALPSRTRTARLRYFLWQLARLSFGARAFLRFPKARRAHGVGERLPLLKSRRPSFPRVKRLSAIFSQPHGGYETLEFTYKKSPGLDRTQNAARTPPARRLYWIPPPIAIT